jgi:hypothetical protein
MATRWYAILPRQLADHVSDTSNSAGHDGLQLARFDWLFAVGDSLPIFPKRFLALEPGRGISVVRRGGPDATQLL